MSCCNGATQEVYINVPYSESKDVNYCSEAVVQMLLAHLGHDVDQDTIHANGWKLEQGLIPFINRYVPATLEKPNLTKIKQWLEAGHPVPLLLNLTNDNGETWKHKVLATGFTEGGRMLTVHDSDRGPDFQLPATELLRADGAVFIHPGGTAGWRPFKFFFGFMNSFGGGN